MGHHEGREPPGAVVPVAEHEPHEHVAERLAEALVQVVAAPQQGAGDDDRRGAPPDLTQSGEEVADHHDLLEHAVLERGEHEDQGRPPVDLLGHGDHVGRDAEGPAGEVDADAGQADEGGEADPLQDGPQTSRSGEPETAQDAGAVAGQQEQREADGHEREADAQQLVGDVEPLAVAARGVEGRGGVAQRAARECGEQAERGVDGRLAEGDAEDEPDLQAQSTAVRRRRARGRDAHRSFVANVSHWSALPPS